jgi:hypothetical protein
MLHPACLTLRAVLLKTASTTANSNSSSIVRSVQLFITKQCSDRCVRENYYRAALQLSILARTTARNEIKSDPHSDALSHHQTIAGTAYKQ